MKHSPITYRVVLTSLTLLVVVQLGLTGCETSSGPNGSPGASSGEFPLDLGFDAGAQDSEGAGTGDAPLTDNGAPPYSDAPDGPDGSNPDGNNPTGSADATGRVSPPFGPCASVQSWMDPSCGEDCANGLDDNKNGLTDCQDPVCASQCGGSACSAFDNCLAAAGCACRMGTNCPTDAAELVFCARQCAESQNCYATCMAVLEPEHEAAVHALQDCADDECEGDPNGTCIHAACASEWGECHLSPTGTTTCAQIDICNQSCNRDSQCASVCAAGASPEAYLDWLTFTECVDNACAGDIDSELCRALASAHQCNGYQTGCSATEGAQSCSKLWECADQAKTAAQLADCVQSQPFVVDKPAAAVASCAWNECFGPNGSPSACEAGLPAECRSIPECDTPGIDPSKPCLAAGCAAPVEPARVRVFVAERSVDSGALFAGSKPAEAVIHKTAFAHASQYIQVPAYTPQLQFGPVQDGKLQKKYAVELSPPTLEPGGYYTAIVGYGGPGQPPAVAWATDPPWQAPSAADNAPLKYRFAYFGIPSDAGGAVEELVDGEPGTGVLVAEAMGAGNRITEPLDALSASPAFVVQFLLETRTWYADDLKAKANCKHVLVVTTFDTKLGSHAAFATSASSKSLPLVE